MMAEGHCNAFDAFRTACKTGLGHPHAPISIQGIRINAHLLAFQRPIRCPAFKIESRNYMKPGKIKELRTHFGGNLPAAETSGRILRIHPTMPYCNRLQGYRNCS